MDLRFQAVFGCRCFGGALGYYAAEGLPDMVAAAGAVHHDVRIGAVAAWDGSTRVFFGAAWRLGRSSGADGLEGAAFGTGGKARALFSDVAGRAVSFSAAIGQSTSTSFGCFVGPGASRVIGRASVSGLGYIFAGYRTLVKNGYMTAAGLATGYMAIHGLFGGATMIPGEPLAHLLMNYSRGRRPRRLAWANRFSPWGGSIFCFMMIRRIPLFALSGPAGWPARGLDRRRKSQRDGFSQVQRCHHNDCA